MINHGDIPMEVFPLPKTPCYGKKGSSRPINKMCGFANHLQDGIMKISFEKT
jgi:hypothetical protein